MAKQSSMNGCTDYGMSQLHDQMGAKHASQKNTSGVTANKQASARSLPKAGQNNAPKAPGPPAPRSGKSRRSVKLD